MEQIIGDFIKILLPSAAVMYAMYLIVRSFLNNQFQMINKDFEKKLVDVKVENSKTILPLRLQAYERMCLFLERISPHSLVLRINNPAFTVSQFQQQLLREIREEFSHNLSQQVYMSDASWGLIKNSMEEIIALINQSGSNLAPDARGVELAKMIFENLLQRTEDPTSKALKYVKNEIRQVF
jgi:hypothetical protein